MSLISTAICSDNESDLSESFAFAETKSDIDFIDNTTGNNTESIHQSLFVGDEIDSDTDVTIPFEPGQPASMDYPESDDDGLEQPTTITETKVQDEQPDPDTIPDDPDADNEEIEHLLSNGTKKGTKGKFKLRSRKGYSAFLLTYSRIEDHFLTWEQKYGTTTDTEINIQAYLDEIYTRLRGKMGAHKFTCPTEVDLVWEHHKCSNECPCDDKQDFCPYMIHFHVLLQWTMPDNKTTPSPFKSRYVLTVDKPKNVHDEFTDLDIRPNIREVRAGDIDRVLSYMLKEGKTNPGYNGNMELFKRTRTRGNFTNEQYIKPDVLIHNIVVNCLKEGLSYIECAEIVQQRKVPCKSPMIMLARIWHIARNEIQATEFTSLNHPHQLRDVSKQQWVPTPHGVVLKTHLDNFFNHDRRNTLKDPVDPNSDFVHHKTRHTMIITGDAGIGKTCFIQQYLRVNKFPHLLLSTTETITGWINNQEVRWSKDQFNDIANTHCLDGLILLFDDFTPSKPNRSAHQLINICHINGETGMSALRRNMTIDAKYHPLVFGSWAYIKIVVCNSLQSCFVNANADHIDNATRAAIVRRCCLYECGSNPLSVQTQNN